MLEAAQSEDAARNARTLAGKGYEHGPEMCRQCREMEVPIRVGAI